MFLVLFNEENAIKGRKLTYIFVRAIFSFEIKIPVSVHLFNKAWIL